MGGQLTTVYILYLFLGLRINRAGMLPPQYGVSALHYHFTLDELNFWTNPDDSAYYIPQDNTNGLTLMKCIQTSDVRGSIINMCFYSAS